ncbi:hypothetical protein BP00DRAFT_77832 [Aspergillus indologenus CBS 114.80]|uniref:Uncharacterized protein n=1 Tax=Aspergillus indologenus CBS 114.80 TaxID=1450541 RepID=A0A2V5HVD2_9EURO|nr:hypothetical protein BP00DRAFT_77832 [Aspergillus indologenus CBS 114.80]
MLKADLHDLATDDTLTNGYAMSLNRTDLNIFYLWNPGPQTSRDVGVFHRHQSLNSLLQILSVGTHDARATVQVNQQRTALCLTRMIFAHDGDWAGLTGWTRDAWFRLSDTFGNYGDFNVKVRPSTDEHGPTEQIPYLEDRNLANSTVSASKDPEPKL